MPELMTDVLVERIRPLIPEAGVVQKRMFGGICFMVNGNMLTCASKTGLMVRVGKAQEDAALAKPHTSQCRPAGRPMPGFIRIEPEGYEADADLKAWIDMARAYVCALSPKPAKTSLGAKA